MLTGFADLPKANGLDRLRAVNGLAVIRGYRQNSFRRRGLGSLVDHFGAAAATTNGFQLLGDRAVGEHPRCKARFHVDPCFKLMQCKMRDEARVVYRLRECCFDMGYAAMRVVL